MIGLSGCFVLLGLAASLPGTTASGQPLETLIAMESARVEQQVIAWRRKFHQNPERANEEVETARIISDHLRQLGLTDVATGVARTGVIGILEGDRPGPTVALRADMDAVTGVTETTDLPFRSKRAGVAHVCGHDAHTAMLMGVATVLSRIKSSLSGKVMFIFQPAEEGYIGDGLGADEFGGSEGARLMLEQGLFTDKFLDGRYKPSAIFGLHVTARPAGEISYAAGSRLPSSDWFRLEVREATSTFARDRGKSPGPYPAMASLISALSAAPGAKNSAEAAQLGFVSVRTLETTPDRRRAVEIVIRSAATSEAEQKEGIRKIKDAAAQTSAQTGMEIAVIHSEFAPPVINNDDLVRMLRAPLERVAGEKNLNEVSFYSPAADDVALLMREVPGIFLLLGVNRPGLLAGEAPTNHAPDFVVNEEVLVIGVNALATLAAEFLDACSRRPGQTPCR